MVVFGRKMKKRSGDGKESEEKCAKERLTGVGREGACTHSNQRRERRRYEENQKGKQKLRCR
jgi:hypothetical protein